MTIFYDFMLTCCINNIKLGNEKRFIVSGLENQNRKKMYLNCEDNVIWFWILIINCSSLLLLENIINNVKTFSRSIWKIYVNGKLHSNEYLNTCTYLKH